MNPGKPLLANGQWKENITQPPFDISGKVPWAPDAWYLRNRPSFTLDPLFHAGTYYVQEASGMFLAHALKQVADDSEKIRVLDLCAAPGGKSTLIQSLISPESMLLSNEVIKSRVPVLYQNMTKWGCANGIISNNDPNDFMKLPGFFDILLIDAPCSGSGLFRKDPEASKVWSPELVKLCSQRQKRILADAWICLKENGFLIYSTCSYSKEENEDLLDQLFHDYACESVCLSPDPSWNIVETRSDQAGAIGYRFYPDKLAGEGFFLSVIRKKQSRDSAADDHDARSKKKIKRIPVPDSGFAVQQLNSWIKEGALQYVHVGETLHGLPSGLLNDFEILKSRLYLKKAGIRLGRAGEHEWVPDHELALANVLKPELPLLDVGKQDALRFLRGEPIEFEVQERGWRVVSYQNQRIGWVKLLEKRMNNYYPKSWRIRQ